MNPQPTCKLSFSLIVLIPTITWLEVVHLTEALPPPRWLSLLLLFKATPQKPLLLLGLIGGFLIACGIIKLLNSLSLKGFIGVPYRKFYRGTRLTSSKKLKKKTQEKGEQISIAGIPMPRKIETLHLLVGGSTGSGKSVLMREIIYSALKRRDRLIIIDPNGDLFTKFGLNKDIILNPYDKRTQKWSIFNEIYHDYDFERLALSLVPRGQTPEEEEWASYGRLLLTQTAYKLFFIGKRHIKELFYWTTIASSDDFKEFLSGTAAESLFVGSSKALASARFVLSSKLSAHLSMPEGSFSLREWLINPQQGNLYITWREDMAISLRPLISTWVDILCTSLLSLPETKERRLWIIIDELASLEKLSSLEEAATKGRKVGLRLVVGLQSTSQLDRIYGSKEAQTLRSCFRSLVVLGGSKTDPKTCEDMSLSLGEHEVERETYSKSQQKDKTSTSFQQSYIRERVVMPAEISSLPDLTGYVAFAGPYDVARVQLTPLNFIDRLPAFIPQE